MRGNGRRLIALRRLIRPAAPGTQTDQLVEPVGPTHDKFNSESPQGHPNTAPVNHRGGDIHDKCGPRSLWSASYAFSVLLILPATSGAQQRPPIAEQIAKAYGLDSFGQIEGIRYTWNAQFPGLNVSDSWEWDPKTDTGYLLKERIRKANR